MDKIYALIGIFTFTLFFIVIVLMVAANKNQLSEEEWDEIIKSQKNKSKK